MGCFAGRLAIEASVSKAAIFKIRLGIKKKVSSSIFEKISRKTFHKAEHKDMECRPYKWFSDQRKRNFSIRTSILKANNNAKNVRTNHLHLPLPAESILFSRI